MKKQKTNSRESSSKFLFAHKAIAFIKSNFVVISILVLFSFILFMYIQRTYVDVIYLDGLLQVPNIDKYFHGTLSFQDIFNNPTWSWGQHRLVGYSIIFLLNAIFFNLNMKIEPAIFMLSYIFIGAVVFLYYSHIISKNSIKKVWFDLSAITILFTIFSLGHPPLQLMTTQFVVGTAIFVVSAILFDKIYLGDSKKLTLVAFLATILLYILVFSGAYFLGALFAFGVVLLHKMFIRNGNKYTREMILAFFVPLVLIVLMSLLTRYNQDGTSLIEKLSIFIARADETFKALLAGLSASTLDLHTFQERLGGNQLIVLANGLLLLIIGIYCLYKFFKLKMYKITYLPLMFMIYTVTIVLITWLGRLTIGGWQWPMNEWYSFHLYFYPLGVLMIIYYMLFSKHRFDIFRHKTELVFIIFSITLIISVQLYSSAYQWRRGLDVHNWLLEKKEAILAPEGKNLKDILYLDNAQSLKAITVLEKYHLSVFRLQKDHDKNDKH